MRRTIKWLCLLVLLPLAPPLAGVVGSVAPGLDVERQAPSSEARAYYRYAMAKMAQRNHEYASAISLLQDAAKEDPDSALLKAELASIFLTVRDYPAAEDAAAEALVIDPANRMAHRVRAQLYYSRARRGIESEANRARAMAELEASLTGGPGDDPAILLTLGRFYFEASQFDRAAAVLLRYADTEPSPPPTPLFLLARTLIHLRRFPEAEEILGRILMSSPDSLQALETMVQVQQAEKKYAESLPYLKKILDLRGGDEALYRQMGDAAYRSGDFTRAVQMFELALREKPSSDSTLYYLAMAEEQIGENQKARQHLQALLEKDPENAEGLFQMARLDEREGRDEEALDGYQALVRVLQETEAGDPRRADIPAFCARAGLLLIQMERPGEAVRELEDCRKQFGARSDILSLLRVRALVYAGMKKQALEEVHRSMDLFPDDWRFMVQEGEVLLHMERDDEAEARFQDLKKRSMDRGEEEKSLLPQLVSDAYFNVGALEERKHHLARSERLLRQAILWNPENGVALNYLGYTWADRGLNLEEALALLLRAVKLAPDNGAFQDSLGWAYFKLGRQAEARAHLLRALALIGEDAAVQEHLGDIESADGHSDEAIRRWQRALELDPEEPEKIRRKIRAHRRHSSRP
ncbi:MAG: tetratricopeptide repeat protein [Acidobacteriota bacterium]